LEYTEIFLPAEILNSKTEACENACHDRETAFRITGDVLKNKTENTLK
jgi:hypothetical protein